MGRRVKYAESLPQGLTHPFVHVAFEVDNHTHLYTAGGGELIEEMAQGLAEAVYRCGRDSLHMGTDGKPHGVIHPAEAAEQAYKSAIQQLLVRDYYQEYLDIQRKIEHYRIWGGQVPGLVIQPKPKDPGTWQVAVPHQITGLPHFYDIPANLLDIPEPDPMYYHEGDLGWYRRGNVSRSLLPVRR